MSRSEICIFALEQKSAEDAADISGAKNRKDRLQVRNAGIGQWPRPMANEISAFTQCGIHPLWSRRTARNGLLIWNERKNFVACMAFFDLSLLDPSALHNRVEGIPASTESYSTLPAGSQALPAAS